MDNGYWIARGVFPCGRGWSRYRLIGAGGHRRHAGADVLPGRTPVRTLSRARWLPDFFFVSMIGWVVVVVGRIGNAWRVRKRRPRRPGSVTTG
jgi:hypothetical protein